MWMEEGFAACICFLSGCLWAQELKYKRCKMLLLCWFHGRVACISCSGGSTSSVAKFLVAPTEQPRSLLVEVRGLAHAGCWIQLQWPGCTKPVTEQKAKPCGFKVTPWSTEVTFKLRGFDFCSVTGFLLSGLMFCGMFHHVAFQ